MKKKEMANEEKHKVVEDCIKLIGDKWADLCFKHDGSRILQQLLKFGHREHRITICDALKSSYVDLATNKYSHYLASKMYYYAPTEELKAAMRLKMAGQTSKLVQHAFAAEVLEYVYSRGTDKQQRELVLSFYGNYFLLMKETKDETGNPVSLKKFVELKPQLAEGIMDKLDGIIQKLMEKGLARLSIVQAIIADFFSAHPEEEVSIKVKDMAQSIKEKVPSLLASKPGLSVACGIFSILDAKDRKTVVKSLPVEEMLTNKIAHLFLIHIITTLDDTQLTKKKILNEALKIVDDHIEDKCFGNVLLSCLCPPE